MTSRERRHGVCGACYGLGHYTMASGTERSYVYRHLPCGWCHGAGHRLVDPVTEAEYRAGSRDEYVYDVGTLFPEWYALKQQAVRAKSEALRRYFHKRIADDAARPFHEAAESWIRERMSIGQVFGAR